MKRNRTLIRWIALSNRCNTRQHYGYFISKYKKEALRREKNILTDYLSDTNSPFPYKYTNKAIKVRITIEEVR